MSTPLQQAEIKIFADGANLEDVKKSLQNPKIAGFTTNPTLMRKSGVEKYVEFAQEFISLCPNMPISFEVFADDFSEMLEQAKIISSWGENVFVKIPITNTKGDASFELISSLTTLKIKVNVTAIFTLEKCINLKRHLDPSVPSVISVFAGRIADAGVDPMPIMKDVVELFGDMPLAEVLWASPRQLFNIVEAEKVGCDIITVPNDLIKKMPTIGKDLDIFSLETVNMFFDDANEAGYNLTA